LNILENDGIKIEYFAEKIVIKPAKSVCLICSKGEVKKTPQYKYAIIALIL